MIQSILIPKNTNVKSNDDSIKETIPPTPNKQKRGRKPKGGKIVLSNQTSTQNSYIPIENIILHLKCNSTDLINQAYESYNSSEFQKSVNFQHNLDFISNPDYKIKQNNDNNSNIDISKINKKLKELQFNLHQNHITNSHSCCFWDSEPFDTQPFYIPKDLYTAYGHFCSPECATAYLFKENIDYSTKIERYQLLNYFYSPILKYTDSFKPTPSPHYTLQKYFGNLTIQELRTLLKSSSCVYILDKPITKILPEFHEDNNDHMTNIKSIHTTS